MTLSTLEVGCRAEVESLTSLGAIRRRLLDVGLVEGTIIECLMRSPGGDPVAYLIRGAVIALRLEDADGVRIRLEGAA